MPLPVSRQEKRIDEVLGRGYTYRSSPYISTPKDVIPFQLVVSFLDELVAIDIHLDSGSAFCACFLVGHGDQIHLHLLRHDIAPIAV